MPAHLGLGPWRLSMIQFVYTDVHTIAYIRLPVTWISLAQSTKPDKAAMSLCLRTIRLTVQSVHLTEDRTDFVAHGETWVTLSDTLFWLGADSCVIAIETCKRLGHGIVGQYSKSPLTQKDLVRRYIHPVFTNVRTLKLSKSENQV